MKTRLFIPLLILTALSIGGAYFYFAQYQKQVISHPLISEFNDDRDTQDIINLMKADWDLLIQSSDYSAEFMLKNRAPSHRDPRYFGKLNIRVLRKNDELLGFTAYYKKSTYQGFILFLAIDKKFRKQGRGVQLINYALQDLKEKGARYVRLVTRTINTKAQALYNKLGFTEVSRDNGFVYFEKKV